MVGGIGPDQVDKIVADLTAVQQMLSAASPQINNLSDLHTQIIIEQLNEESAPVQGTTAATGTPILSTDLGQFVGRSVHDIHRDIIDIAQGDARVQAIFNPTPLPDLATAPVPFHDNAEQTAFLTQFIQDSSHLGQMATTIANDGFQGDVAGLLQQIQTFAAHASAFDQSQGGLYSARFWNELRSDGTAGTAAHALIEGLQKHNAGEVSAAAEQLATNAEDLANNNLKADGKTYADVVAAAEGTAVIAASAGAGAQGHAAGVGGGAGAGDGAAALTATDLFNDATTRMVGGIGPDQVDKIVADLTAVQKTLRAASPHINDLSDLHTQIIVNQLDEEIASVKGTTSATGTLILGTDLGQFVGRSINDIHRDIIDIAQGDAGVQAIFNPTPLPDLATSPVPFKDNAEQTTFLTQFIQDSNHLGQMATTIATNGFHDIAGLVQQIQTFAA